MFQNHGTHSLVCMLYADFSIFIICVEVTFIAVVAVPG